MELISLFDTKDLDQSEVIQFWEVIIALMGEKANSKMFYKGRREGPQFEDIILVLSKLRASAQDKPLRDVFPSDSWDKMTKILRFLF